MDRVIYNELIDKHIDFPKHGYIKIVGGKAERCNFLEAEQSDNAFAYSTKVLDHVERGFHDHNVTRIVEIPIVTIENPESDPQFKSFDVLFKAVFNRSWAITKDGNKLHYHGFIEAGVIDELTIKSIVEGFYKAFMDCLNIRYPAWNSHISLPGTNGVKVIDSDFQKAIPLAEVYKIFESMELLNFHVVCFQYEAQKLHKMFTEKEIEIGKLNVPGVIAIGGYIDLMNFLVNQKNMSPCEADELIDGEFINSLRLNYLGIVTPILAYGFFSKDIESGIFSISTTLKCSPVRGKKYDYFTENNKMYGPTRYGRNGYSSVIHIEGAWKTERLLFDLIRFEKPNLFTMNKEQSAEFISNKNLGTPTSLEARGKKQKLTINLKKEKDVFTYIKYRYGQFPRTTIQGERYVQIQA